MKKRPVDMLIIHAGELLTIGPGPKDGKQMDRLEIIKDGAMAIKGGKIIDVGVTQCVLHKYYPDINRGQMIDARGKVVMPGLVDPHTHLVFAGSRHHEFEQKIAGLTYSQIHTRGINAGILYTVEMTRGAGRETLIKNALRNLAIMLAHGTTTIEAKSGYGLDKENEIKILEIIQDKKIQRHPTDIVPTFLGAHAVPQEYKEKRADYVWQIISWMKEIKDRGLAEFCDVFCDPLGFSFEESAFILYHARELGFGLKIHAEQTRQFGGAKLAANVKAVSADHLDFAPAKDIEAMAGAGVIGVLLPGVTHHLMEYEKVNFPRLVKNMVERDLPIALATDFNPGSCPARSMQTIMELAARLYRMSPAQIINASTINAAHAINCGKKIGSLEKGKQADVVIFNCPQHEMLINEFGTNRVDGVIKKGELVYSS